MNFCLAYKEFEDTKGAIRIRISTKNRQHNGQIKVQKDKQKTPVILLIYSVNSCKSLASDRGKKNIRRNYNLRYRYFISVNQFVMSTI